MDNIAESLTTCIFAKKKKVPFNCFSLRLTLLKGQGLVLIELQHKGISSGAKPGSDLLFLLNNSERALSLEKLRRGCRQEEKSRNSKLRVRQPQCSFAGHCSKKSLVQILGEQLALFPFSQEHSRS